MKILIPDLFKPIPHPWALPIRGYCQTDSYRCGLSTAWTVVEFYQPEAKFSEFSKICKPVPIWGLSYKQMVKCLRKQGLHVSESKVEFELIEESILKGHLILICIGGEENDDHWIVIYGVNRTGRILLSGRTTPGFSRTSMSWRKFSKRCNDIMLVVHP